MTTRTAIRIASTALSLAVFGTLSAAAVPQASVRLAEAAAEEQPAVIEIVAPKGEGSLGTIRFETGNERHGSVLSFGGPR